MQAWARVPALVVAALAMAMAVSAAPARATFGGRPGLIAYGSDFFGKWFTVRADGGRKRRMLTNVAWVQWSRGGTRLLFTSATRADPSVLGLWTSRPDGAGRKLRLDPDNEPVEGFSYEPDFPSWAPGGRRIVFEASLDTPDPARGRICILRLSDGSVREVRLGSYPAWSPDGRLIAFERTPSVIRKGGNLAVMRPSGHGLRILVRGGSHDLVRPDFSPNGRRLAFLDDAYDADDQLSVVTIRVVNVRTQHVTTVLRRRVTRGEVGPVRWTPDGRRLVYLQAGRLRRGGSAGRSHLYTIRPDGSGRRRLLTLPPTGDFAWQTVR